MIRKALYFTLYFLFTKIYCKPLEITVTGGTVEPLPIAVTNFIYTNDKEQNISKKILEVIKNNLENSGLFRQLSNKAFLQSDTQVFQQPLFADWRLIDANLIVTGSIKIKNDTLVIRIKLWDVYQEKLIINKKIAGIKSSNWRVLSHIISNLVYESVTGQKGYFDTKIVYVAEKGFGKNKTKRLALMDYDGFNHRYLTDGKNLVLTPRFSPNGKEIVYLSYLNNRPSVYLLNIFTRKKEILGKFKGMSFAPRFSYDGREIIFSLTKKGSSNIYILNLNSKKITQITKNKHINTSPSFSPDGTKIVFSSDRAGKQNLYITSKTKKNKAKRISFGPGNYATPVWSPRGDYIAFTKSYKKKFFIGLMKSNGKNERIISEGYLAEGPTWSPNGRTLAFNKIKKSINGMLTSKVFTIDVTGNLEKELITPNEASDPDWGPSIEISSN